MLRVLKRDFLRILKAPASIVVVLALIVLPSLYTWFNVVGFWNPYGNTGNLRVCVVNEDAGSSSDLTGAINLGDMVVEQLHDNDQLGWDFVDYDTAMEAVKSGHAYAAFVLPRDFSADLLTLLSGDFQQPQLEYYVNEKMNPVSPKITDTGANTLDTTINSTFVATVAKTVTDALGEEVGVAQGKIDDAHTNALAGVDKAQQSISGARDSVQGLRDAADQSQTKVADAASLLSDADEVLGDLSGQMLIVQSLMGTTQTDVSKLTSGLMGAMDSGSIFLSQSAAKVNTAIGGAAGSATEAQGRVDGAIAQGNAMVSASQAVVAQMEALVAQMDDNDPNKASLEKAIERLKQSNTNASRSLSELSDMSADMGRVAESVSSASDSVNTAVQTTISNADSYRGTLSSDTFPAINAGVGNLNVAVGNLAAAASAQRVLVDQAISLTGQLSETLATARSALDQTDGVLADLQTSIDTVKTDLVALKTSTAITDFFGDGTTIDAEKVASFMQSPTEVKTEYLFPLNAYGSGMAPLFINMSLWIGVFMLMVIMRIEVDDEGIENLTAAQRYIARYLFFGGMVSLQAIVCCVGCLAIGVQCESVALFLLTAVLASLTYLAIQLTLSTTLQHIGKGICVILIFVQIPGATGLYPIEMTSPFFQFIYPFFPFTYGINALRETIAGFYGLEWVSLIAHLGIFFAIFLAIGLALRPYFSNLIRLFAREIERSDIINGEEVHLPERRFRVAQLVRVLSDREDFRHHIADHAARFICWYPRLKRGALIVGIAVPAVIAVVFAVTAMEKVVVLTLWLVWLVLVLTFLVVVEFIRDNIERQASLNAMTDDEVRTLFAARKVFIQPTMVGASAGGASTRSSATAYSRTSALDEKDSAKLDALMAELLSRGSKEVVGRHAHGRTNHGEGAGVGKSAGAKAESLKGAVGVANATNVGTAGAADAADVAGVSSEGNEKPQVAGSQTTNDDMAPMGAHAIPGSDGASLGAHAAPDADKASTGAHAAVRKGKAASGAHVAPNDAFESAPAAGDTPAAGDSAPVGKAVAGSSTPPSASGSKSDENGEVR
ncbi:YhgE/Pip family protein [Ellagibacter isourolithinifaciens]|uniref:YhgE/Pip family protein n=1 Tax=Ellagibacter isourolithinifaciens TaxID=2137581 RepID=UPI003A941E6B